MASVITDQFFRISNFSNSLTSFPPFAENFASEWALAVQSTRPSEVTVQIPVHTVSVLITLSILFWHSQRAKSTLKTKPVPPRRSTAWRSPMYLVNEEFLSHYAALKE